MTHYRHPSEGWDLVVVRGVPGPIKTPAFAGVTDYSK